MIKGLLADIIVVIYLLVTLFFRIMVEGALVDSPIISMCAGLILLLFLWSLIKTRILIPDYFGLLRPKSNE